MVYIFLFISLLSECCFPLVALKLWKLVENFANLFITIRVAQILRFDIFTKYDTGLLRNAFSTDVIGMGNVAKRCESQKYK
jgi:hypothetical protein